MQPKNLAFSNYNFGILKKIIIKIISIKRTTILIVFLIFFFLATFIAFISNFHESIINNERNSSIADFKLDINKLSEATAIIESERKFNNSSITNIYGSDGKLVNIEEITPDLEKALINISDANSDGAISEEEISELEIMRLNPDIVKKELKNLKFELRCADCNLKNYLIITHGDYIGTILYNGPFKFIDADNKRYFGLELFN